MKVLPTLDQLFCSFILELMLVFTSPFQHTCTCIVQLQTAEQS